MMTSSLIIVCLAAVCAALLVAHLLRRDAAIDQKQEAAAELAGLLESCGLTRLAEIMRGVAALSIAKTIERVTALCKQLKSPEDVFNMLIPCFQWALPKAIDREDTRKKILAAIVAHPEAAADVAKMLKAAAELAAD